MTEQPETELEYHFKKHQRTVVGSVMLLGAVVLVTASGLTAESNPSVSIAFMGATALLFAEVHAFLNDGRLRRFFNFVLRTDIEDLERPDERGSTEMIADD